MTLSVTPEQANTVCGQIDDHMKNVRSLLSNINDTQQSMTGSSWQGSSAHTYANTSQQQQEDFHTVLNTLQHVVDTGKAHIQSVAHADAS